MDQSDLTSRHRSDEDGVAVVELAGDDRRLGRGAQDGRLRGGGRDRRGAPSCSTSARWTTSTRPASP